MSSGIPLAFAAYFGFSLSDAMIKLAGRHTTVFEIAFFVTLFSIIPIIASKPAELKWRHVMKMNRPLVVHLRGISGTLGGMCAIYAFTHLPLAEAYALIFLIPLIVTLLSVLILREPVGIRRWLAVALGFVGILMVVRPGFREITPAHVAGLGIAFFGAITIIALRTLSTSENRTTIMSIVIPYALIANGAMMLSQFQWPDRTLMLTLLAAGILTGIGHYCITTATRLAAANMVAPVQYSQIIWAVVFGWLIFSELPDGWTVAGLVIVGISGLATFIREEVRFGWSRKVPLIRNRL
ncbi:MAG: DMT family transporter [Nitratireductor sp.]